MEVEQVVVMLAARKVVRVPVAELVCSIAAAAKLSRAVTMHAVRSMPLSDWMHLVAASEPVPAWLACIASASFAAASAFAFVVAGVVEAESDLVGSFVQPAEDHVAAFAAVASFVVAFVFAFAFVVVVTTAAPELLVVEIAAAMAWAVPVLADSEMTVA